MPKFTKTIDQLENRFDKWLFVLKNLNRFEKIPDILKEKIFEKLFAAAEIAKFTPEQILSYEDSPKYYRDLKNSLDTAHNDGKIEGLIEGEKKGRIEGRIEGKEEEKRKIARNLLQAGVTMDIISQTTGLSKQEIEKLQ